MGQKEATGWIESRQGIDRGGSSGNRDEILNSSAGAVHAAQIRRPNGMLLIRLLSASSGGALPAAAPPYLI
jgi:hypothetical protein